MIVFGLISSASDLLTVAVLLLIFHAGEATFQTSWFMISLLTELAVVLVLRTHKLAFRSSPGQLLLWSTLAAAAATFAIPFLGALGSVFSFVPHRRLRWPLLSPSSSDISWRPKWPRYGSSGPSRLQIFRSGSELARPSRLSPDRILSALSRARLSLRR